MKTYNPFLNTLLILSIVMSTNLFIDHSYHGYGGYRRGNNRKSTHARFIQRIDNKMIHHYKHG
jgi:hypothetical protein